MTHTATIRVKKVYPPKSQGAPWNVAVEGAGPTVRYNIWENKELADALTAREGYDAFITWQQAKPYTTKTGVTLDQRNIIAYTAPAGKPATQAVAQQAKQPLAKDLDIDIPVQALAKGHPWVAQVDFCDSAGYAQVLDAIELAWRMHKAGKVVPAGIHPPAPKSELPNSDAEFNDEIPY